MTIYQFSASNRDTFSSKWSEGCTVWGATQQLVTLLTSFKALLQTSYFGESLGVFWQIVCNKVKEEKHSLTAFTQYNKTNAQAYPLTHSKLHNAKHNIMDGYDDDIKIQWRNYEIVFTHTESKWIEEMVK